MKILCKFYDFCFNLLDFLLKDWNKDYSSMVYLKESILWIDGVLGIFINKELLKNFNCWWVFRFFGIFKVDFLNVKMLCSFLISVFCILEWLWLGRNLLFW